MFHQQKPQQHELPAELAALEARLAHLTPAAPRVDRDRLMFAAGRAVPAARSSSAASRFWPAATALMTAATVLLAVLLAFERRAPVDVASADPLVTDRPPSDETPHREEVTIDAPAPPPGAWSWTPRHSSGYLALRHIALTEGVGALDREPISAAATNDLPWPRPATARELLDELLPEATRPRRSQS